MSILDITDRCNLQCIYCCRGNKQSEKIDLTNDLIINIIKQIIQLRGTFVVIQGGEPLLKEGIVDLLNKTKKLKSVHPGSFFNLLKDLSCSGFSGNKLTQNYMRCLIEQNLPLYCLTTNGMIYSDEIRSALYNSGFYLEVSLDGPNAEINKKTRLGISFDAVTENIKKYSQKLPVEISCTITEHNVELLPQMVNFAKSLGCICLKFSPVIQIGCRKSPDSLWTEKYLKAINDAIDLYSDDFDGFLLKIKIYQNYFQSSYGRELYQKLMQTKNILLEVHQCSAFEKIKDVYIDTKLNVYGCASMKNDKKFVIGNLSKMSLKDIWASEIRKALLSEIKCKKICQNSDYTCTAVALAE